MDRSDEAGERRPDAGAAMAHVELFGPVAIQVGADRIVPTGYAAQLLALLAAARGPIAATHLLDVVWPEAPGSGLNVVQRHLSALRRQLRASGHRELAHGMLRHRGGAYRLDGDLVTSDIELLETAGRKPGGPSVGGDGPSPRWWREPLVGLPWEPFVALRARLDRLAVAAAHGWLTAGHDLDDATVIAAIGDLAHRHPGDELLWSTFRHALQREAAVESAGRVGVAETEPGAARLGAVGTPVAAWLSGDTGGSLAALDEAARELDGDTARRVRRWLSTLDPADGLVRLLLGDLVSGLHTKNPFGGERCIVSLDAYTLVQYPDGLVRARAELAAASEPSERLRAQRVLTFALLGAPLDEGLPAALEALEAIDHPEARIEWLRFEATLALRQGRFDAVPGLLDEVNRALAERYPDAEPWYDAVAWTVLRHCPATRALFGRFDRSQRFFEHPVNQSVVDLSSLWHDFERGRVTSATSAVVRQLTTQLSMPAGHAIQILHLLALGRADAAAERIRPFRGRLAMLPRDALGQLLPVAAGRVAVATGDAHLAREVERTIEPYRGEWLGAWPFDLVIGPADELIAACRELG